MTRESNLDKWLEAHPGLSVLLLLWLGLIARLWTAWGTFLNPDEALHFRIANQASLLLAYKTSLWLAHPPLYIFVLYFCRAFGTSEFVLRLPSVIAGTAFCWFFFKWVTSILGRAAGWIGFVFACFLPPMIGLSAEVRQYALLMCFAGGAAYFLEQALTKNSASRMALCFVCLYLALFSHYSAF